MHLWIDGPTLIYLVYGFRLMDPWIEQTEFNRI